MPYHGPEHVKALSSQSFPLVPLALFQYHTTANEPNLFTWYLLGPVPTCLLQCTVLVLTTPHS